MSRKRSTKKATKRTAKRRASSVHAAKAPRCVTATGKRCRCTFCHGKAHNPPVNVQPLGRITAIEYVHADDGRKYRHKFDGNEGLFIAEGSEQLIVSPVRIVSVNRKHFIGE